MTAAPTAAPTSTITAAPAKENTMYAVPTIPVQTVAELVEARGGHWESISEYVDTTPPDYDDVSAYAMSLIDRAVEARATGELSPEAFDDLFASAIAHERKPAPLEPRTRWLSEDDQLALEEIQEESRPTIYTPPVNGLTETDRLAVAAARRQEADQEYAAMLAAQDVEDAIDEIGRMDFSTIAPPEYDFSGLYSDLAEMEVAA